MAKSVDKWIHSFTVTDNCVHKKGYTIYKITSIVFPVYIPETLTCLTIWKRFNDIKKLYKDISKRHKELHLRGTVPTLLKDNNFFKRFHPEIIEERKAFILKLLDFIAQHPALYKSHAFINFFEESHSPNLSPKRSITHRHTDDEQQQQQNNHMDINCLSNTNNITQPITINHNNIENSSGIEHNTSYENYQKYSNKNNIVTPTLLNNTEDDTISSILTETISSTGSGDSISILSIGIEQRQDDLQQQQQISTAGVNINNSIEDRFDNQIDYIYEAALEFSSAVQYEVQLNYRNAFEHYKNGIDKLLMGVRDDTEPNRKRIAKEKVQKYLQRAESIYENFILNDDELNKKSTVIVHQRSSSVDDNNYMNDHNNNNNSNNNNNNNNNNNDSINSINSINNINILNNNEIDKDNYSSIERPINQLAKFKVIKIIDNVMQVQDVTNKKIYIMKAIQKSSTTSKNASQMIILPQNIPFMVSLLAFYQSETTIYLLLQQAKGGKLWDYIKSYESKTTVFTAANRTDSLNSLFTEPIILTTTAAAAATTTITTTTSPSVINTTIPQNNTKNPNLINLTINNDKDNNLTITSTDYINENNNKIIDKNILSFTQLSNDMDVLDLVNCSQKLLVSVSNTLEQIKDIKVSDDDNDEQQILPQQNLNDAELQSTKIDEHNIIDDSRQSMNTNTITINEINAKCCADEDDENILLNNICQNKFIVNYKTDKILHNSKLLPNEIVKRWTSELIMAVIKLHEKEIICFDLNPNNLLLGSSGELLITYFYQRINNNLNNNNNDRSELLNQDALTNLYIAPERPLTKLSDWWSVGIILFELITGYKFLTCHPSGVTSYYEIQYPQKINISGDCTDLLNGLIQINPEKRLTDYDIQMHRYFTNIDWNKLACNDYSMSNFVDYNSNNDDNWNNNTIRNNDRKLKKQNTKTKYLNFIYCD